MAADTALEREISRKFEEIADIGWFEGDVAEDFAQLKAVKRFLQPHAGQRILDAGCARGRFTRHIAKTGAQVFGVDLTWTFVQSAKTTIPAATFTSGSLSALPFADNTFDSVYCVEVLEHLPDTRLALSEMARVIKPGGMLLVIDKSLHALDPSNGLPTFLVKPWNERKGKWMYPPDFAFRERWFWPRALAREFKAFFSHVDFHFLPDCRRRASKLYRWLPFLSLDVAWVGRK